MVSWMICRLVVLVFGMLYPAYASYKAVKSKNIREYVRWMMYWIVFAIFMAAETFTDIFISWFDTRIGRLRVGKAHPLPGIWLTRKPLPLLTQVPVLL